jgi:very-short-patch-repair endonuclease
MGMTPEFSLRKQKVTPEKAERAKELRRNMTGAEKVFWQRVRANRLGGFHFRRQQVIAGFIVDFYCHAATLVVELDGPIHDHRADYDRERTRILTERGVRVMRFRNEEVFQNMDSVLKRVLQALREGQAGRAPQPIPPPLPSGEGESGGPGDETPPGEGE